MAGKCIIVMGVCGSGKSSIGLKVANALGAKFIDGDDLHPRANIQKMAAGNPLNDEDRAPWLERIRDAAYSLERKNELGVIVCSALKKQYRDQIPRGQRLGEFPVSGWQPVPHSRTDAGTAGPLHARSHGTKPV